MEVVNALTEQVLSGQLDSEDGTTERLMEDILNKYNLKREP